LDKLIQVTEVAYITTPSFAVTSNAMYLWLNGATTHSHVCVFQGRALYAAEADRLRNWAEDRARFSFTDAMEMYTENTWLSVFSLSVVCAFIILSSTGNNMPGT